jgi:hypothetical protein
MILAESKPRCMSEGASSLVPMHRLNAHWTARFLCCNHQVTTITIVPDRNENVQRWSLCLGGDDYP